MKKSSENRVARDEGKIILFLMFFLYVFYSFLTPVWSEINNTIAYSVSNTSSTAGWDLRPIASKTMAQTIRATANETWYGIVVYLDRMGFSSSTDSVRLRFRGGEQATCGTPDTNQVAGYDRDVYIKISDIPDGDIEIALPPDSIARGYAIWFIFSSPVSVKTDSCYNIFLNAPYTDASNCVNHINGTNGYANGSSWEQTTGSWVNQATDMDFRVIKDKYALIAVRRLPFNLRGAIAINSSERLNSLPYSDSLHRWLNTSQNIGGSWGQGLNIGWGEYGAPMWRGTQGDSQGIGGSKPYYFATTDTVTSSRKDTIDNYINRRWITEFQPFVRCGDNYRGCIDSTDIDKMWNYMLNHNDIWGKIYKGGVFTHSTYRKWGIPNVAGDTAELGDSSGTVYHHTHKTFASGKFKFLWTASYQDGASADYQYTTPVDWQGLQDSLNVRSLPFNQKNMRDGMKGYRYTVNGASGYPHPDDLWRVCRRTIAKLVSDSLHILIPHSHLNWYVSGDSGMDADDKDTLRAVVDSVSSWKLWMPSLKALLNQQAASAFAQITVDRPSGSKRRINIRSLYDWNWGSRVPDREEIYYLTFITYAPESLIVTLNASDTLADSTMINQQDVAAVYNSQGATSAGLRQMSWVGMYNRTAGRKVIIEGEAEAPPAEGENKKRTRIILQLLK